MKKLSQRILSMFLAVVFMITMVGSLGGIQAKASELNREKIKSLLIQKRDKQTTIEAAKERLAEKLGKTVPETKNEEKKSPDKINPDEKIRIMVQLNGEPAAYKEAKDLNALNPDDATKIDRAVKSVKSSQASIISKVEKITGSKIRRSYGYLFNGFSVVGKRGDIPKIAAVSGVKSVTEAKVYYPDMKFAKELTQAYSVWQDLGYKGEGMVISIIDTGIDPTHKDLILSDPSKAKLTSTVPAGPGRFFTTKVPYGYNFADGNYEITDKNPNNANHGMHVAGIVAANGRESDVDSFKSIQGVAPEAQLLAMKVFTNNPDDTGAYSDDIIAAIEDSVLHGADVINMSLGSTSGFQDENDPEQEAIKNAVDKGVVVVISAGNSALSTTNNGWNPKPTNLLGITDTATVGSPGTAKDALTVASYENSNKIFDALDYETDDSISGTISYIPGDINPVKVLNGKYEVVDCGIGDESGFEGKDLNGKIALIKRGKITFTEKALNAERNNAAGVIIYNQSASERPDGGDEPFGMALDPSIKIPVVSIGNADGLMLKNYIDKNVKISFNGKSGSAPSKDSNDMSPFTSWGPTPSLEFKPEITAPGGDIYSLKNGNSYQTLSGTSMAAPHVAGAEALILQAIKARNPDIKGRELVEFAKNTTINTAKVEMDKNHPEVPYSPRRQGAGMIQIKDAINNSVIAVGPDGSAAVALKEIDKAKTFTITLKNYGDRDVTYELQNQDVLSETMNEKNEVYDYKVPGAEITFDKSSVTVPAKGEARVFVTISLPDDFNKQQFVEGYVRFNSSGSSVPSLVVPYIGFYGRWSELQIVDKPVWEDSKVTEYLSKYYSDLYSDFYGVPLNIHYAAGTYLGTLGAFGFIPGGFYYADDYDFGSVNPDKIAFSPNGDGLSDLVLPNLYLLRNAKELKVEVLDKDKKALRTLSVAPNIRKDIFEDEFANDIYGSPIVNAIWDGTLYNQSTGKYEPAPQGQYLVRVIAKPDMSDAGEQIIDMPVKIDVVAPEIKITSNDAVEITEPYAEEIDYNLTGTISDDYSGPDPLYMLVFVNGEPVEVDYDGANFSGIIKLRPNTNNIIEIGTLDYAGNFGYTFKNIEVGLAEPVKFANFGDGMFTNDSGYVVSGVVRNDVEVLKINNEDVEISDDNDFTHKLSLVEGENNIVVSAFDRDNNELFNETYKVYLDTKAPEITIIEPELGEGNIFYAKDDVVKITGKVTDEHLVGVNINGESIAVDENGNFTTEISVTVNTYVLVEAYDEAGNFSQKEFTIVPKDNAEPFVVYFDNLYSFNVLTPADAENDVFTITGHVNHPTKVFKINDADVKFNTGGLSFNVPVKLQQGTNRIRVYAEDESGTVVYDYAYRILYDSESPKLIITEPVAKADGKVYTNGDKLTIKGEVSDNTYGYVLYINGNALMNLDRYPAVGEETNKKTFNYSIDVKDGDRIIIDLVDEFENTTEDVIDVVVDKVSPKAPIITPDKDITKPTNKDVNLTIEANPQDKDIERIEYSFDNNKWLTYGGPVKVVANGNVYARTIDFAGNLGEVAQIAINNIDRIPPVITITGVEDGKFYNSNVKAILTSNEGTVAAKLNGKEYKGEDITEEGKYELVATAVDEAGNTSESKVVFTIDKTPPVIAIEGVLNGKSYNEAVKAKIATNEGTVTAKLNGKEYKGEDITEEGQYELVATAVDEAGNTSESKVNFTIDKTAPVITLEGLENGKAYNNTVNPKITVNEGTTTMFLDGRTYNGGNITSSGSHELRITAVDAAGNTSEMDVKFTIKVVIGNDTKATESVSEAIKNSPDKNVSVELNGITVVDESIFKAIAGVDKNVSFTVGNGASQITWTFNGAQIRDSNIKDIDLSLNATAPNKDIIEKIDNNAQIISFKDNGVLPSPAKIRVKIDSSKIDTTKGIYFYYYNPDKKTAELIEGPLTSDKDGYVEVTITHCSDYFFSNYDNETVVQNIAKLPKTGSMMDRNMLVNSGLFLVTIGGALIFTSRRKKKEQE